MKALTATLLLFAAAAAPAFPPAPDHTLHGVVRDENGRPLDTGEGTIILSGATTEITRVPTDTSREPGQNYRLHIPMESATLSQLSRPNALRPSLPFTMRVILQGRSYVPIQMAGRSWTAGAPSGRTRLDLTLGLDSDGDGIPDSWEQALIDSDASGRLAGLADVKPGEDLDHDGLSNLAEYQIGTYALDRLDGLTLDILETRDGMARLRFAAVAGRTYHFKSSATLSNWGVEAFRLTAAADATLRESFRAAETGLVDIYVPLNGRQKMNFRLHAE